MAGRTVVIGLDGFSFLVLDEMIARGEASNLGRLIAGGVRGPLRSTLMPNSFPGWTTCATGCNEGKHGVFMPLVRRADNFSMKAMDATDVRMKTVWEVLSERGRRSLVVNDPCSYPPQPIDGWVVAGMTTPDSSAEWTHPPELKPELLERVPGYIVDVNLFGKSRADILAELERSADERLAAALYLLGSREWDLAWVTFTESDRVQHRFWADRQADHPKHTDEFPDAVDRMYRRLDAAVGRILDALPEGTRVFIVSDHGFGPFYCLFNTTGWLIDHGYAAQPAGRTVVKRALARLGVLGQTTALYRRFRRAVEGDARHGVEKMRDQADSANTGVAYSGIDWSRTRAYATLDGGIRINMRGREPHGIVDPAEAPELAREIRSRLERVTFPDGSPVFEAVLLAEEAFNGPVSDRGPDIVMPVRWGAYLGPLDGSPYLHDFHRNTGEHAPFGVFVAWGPGVRSGVEIVGARLLDIAPTVLASLGEPPTCDMDGRVLTDVFETDAIPPSALEPAGTSSKDPSAFDTALSSAEEELLEERLRGLGYID